MTNSPPPENDLSHEFTLLAENLKRVLQSAWESDERRKVQAEVERGVASLNVALTNFAQSDGAQKMKTELNDLREKAQLDKVEANVHEGVLSALRQLNAALEKAAKPEEKKDTNNEL